MALTRRDFLKVTGASAVGALVFNGCSVPERELRVQSPVSIPEDVVSGRDNWYASVCRQCPAGCGVLARVVEGRAKKMEGNPDHPLNRGKLCARGQAAVHALYHPDRITGSLSRQRGAVGGGTPIPWEQALDDLVARLRANAGTKTVLITEPLRGHLALVVQRLAQGTGLQHMALEPLENTNHWAAVKQVFGQDLLPEYDIRNANYLVSFGASFLETWGSPVHYGVHYGDFRQGRQGKRGYFVQVEPRFSATTASADEWVPVKPGTEGVLALSMAYVIIQRGEADPVAADGLTGGKGLAALEAYRPERAAELTGVNARRIEELAVAFSANRPALAIGGGLAAAQTNGLFNLTSVLSLNLLVGNVGKPGGVLFNPAPPLGLPMLNGATFAQWQGLVGRMGRGEVGLLLVQGADPAYALPRSLGFQDALKNVPQVVSFASFWDETALQADVVLPTHTQLEDWGSDVPDPGPGHQVVTFQQPVVQPFADSRSFGDVLLAAAEGLGLGQQLPWATMQEVLRQGAAVLFKLGRGSVAAPDADSFWAGVLQRGGWWDTRATATVPGGLKPPAAPAQPPQPSFDGDGEFYLMPFPHITLNDGRGAHLPWLQGTPDPLTTAAWQTWVEINRKRAAELDIREGDVLAIESPQGRIEALAYLHPATPRDVISIALGQGHTDYGRYATGRGENPVVLLATRTDPASGALAWGATRVRVTKTGARRRLPKFEGTEFAEQLEEKPVIQVTNEA